MVELAPLSSAASPAIPPPEASRADFSICANRNDSNSVAAWLSLAGLSFLAVSRATAWPPAAEESTGSIDMLDNLQFCLERPGSLKILKDCDDVTRRRSDGGEC